MKKVIVIGGGGHAKVVMDVIRAKNNCLLTGFLDDADFPEVALETIASSTLEPLWSMTVGLEIFVMYPLMRHYVVK